MLTTQVFVRHVGGPHELRPVERSPSAQDKRAQELRVTPGGHKLAAQATVQLRASEKAALHGLSAGHQAILIELLHKVALSPRMQVWKDLHGWRRPTGDFTPGG